MKKNNKEIITIINDDCSQEEVEAILHFAITKPPPRREYLVYTKGESVGKDKNGKNLIITYISRVEENKNGVQTLTSITDEEFSRCQQVIKEMIELNKKEENNEN